MEKSEVLKANMQLDKFRNILVMMYLYTLDLFILKIKRSMHRKIVPR